MPSSPSSLGVSSERIGNIVDVSPFWKKNEPLLRELERSEMPSKSRLIYKEIASNTRSNNNHVLTNYDLVNIYDNRKRFFGILAELSQDRSSIIREEIVAGSSLSDVKKTVVDGNMITNKAHIYWLKSMSQNDVFRLFRT